jgi:anti-sigma B factor antagonist
MDHQATGASTCDPDGPKVTGAVTVVIVHYPAPPVTEHRPPPDLTTTVERDGETTVLRVGGEVDLVNAHELAAALAEAAEAGGELVVDLREVPFMDSTGLRSIIQMRERFERDGRPPLRVRLDEEGPVARLLDLVGLRDVLTDG